MMMTESHFKSWSLIGRDPPFFSLRAKIIAATKYSAPAMTYRGYCRNYVSSCEVNTLAHEPSYPPSWLQEEMTMNDEVISAFADLCGYRDRDPVEVLKVL